MRLDLPVDEDDYLMPSPQPSGLATVGPSHQHYMDLMADASGEAEQSKLLCCLGVSGIVCMELDIDVIDFLNKQNNSYVTLKSFT